MIDTNRKLALDVTNNRPESPVVERVGRMLAVTSRVALIEFVPLMSGICASVSACFSAFGAPHNKSHPSRSHSVRPDVRPTVSGPIPLLWGLPSHQHGSP